MRRILLGGFGLALGVWATPAAAQDNRTPQAPRAAKLGIPTAVPAAPAPADPGVTPIGLLTPRQYGTPVPVVPTPMPPPMPAPGYPQPPGVPMGGMPMGTPMPGTGGIPSARPTTGTPSVVEDRGTGTATLGNPTPMIGGAVIVPSVGPEGWGGLGVPDLECPQCEAAQVGQAALGRVASCGRWWTTGEYLMWWTKSADLPPLVTTSSPASNGQLGRPDTQVLLGGPFGDTFHSGARFGVGRWFGDCQRRGIEGRFFFLGQAYSEAAFSSDQFPVLARPFFNVNPGTPSPGSSSEIVTSPGRSTGRVAVAYENTVWGAEANYRRFLWSNCNARLDAIVGYRYLNVSEKLTITESFTRTGPPVPGLINATSGVVYDQFATENKFNGGQIGLVGEWRRGRWSLDGRASVAFGNLNRSADISGGQALTLADGSQAGAPGGLLAVPGANIGKYEDSVFAVVPEVGFNVGFQVRERLRLFVGYNFLYLGNALRPGDTIDPYIDAARIPNFVPGGGTPLGGVPQPQPRFKSSDFFAQGISFGLQFNW